MDREPILSVLAISKAGVTVGLPSLGGWSFIGNGVGRSCPWAPVVTETVPPKPREVHSGQHQACLPPSKDCNSSGEAWEVAVTTLPPRLGQARADGGQGWICACCPGTSSLEDGQAHSPVMPRPAGSSGSPATRIILFQGAGAHRWLQAAFEAVLKPTATWGACLPAPAEGQVSASSGRTDSTAQGTRWQAGVARVNLSGLALLHWHLHQPPRQQEEVPCPTADLQSWGQCTAGAQLAPGHLGPPRLLTQVPPLGGALRDPVAALCLFSDPRRTG